MAFCIRCGAEYTLGEPQCVKCASPLPRFAPATPPVQGEGHKSGGADYRWTAILALAVGLLATAATWYGIRTHERSQVRWATRLAAQAIQMNLVTDMEWQLLGLDRLAMLWKAADAAEELWTRNAELYIQHRPGCLAVEWLSPAGETRVLVTGTARSNAKSLAFGEVPKTLLEAVATAKAAMITAPERRSDGSRHWVVAYPVYAGGQPRGFIVTFFDLEQSLEHILGDVEHLGFSFSLWPPNQPEYLAPGSSREHDGESETIDVPLSGVKWQLRVWPNSDVVSAIKTRVPEVTLVAGSALSLLLALTLYFAFGAVLSSARTRQANDALQREISLRKGAQEELLRAHAELETRIDERTAELAAANVLLKKEVTEHQRAEESLRELTGRLFQVQDEERRRVARELHDGAAQNLVALTMNVGMIRDAVPADDIGTKELVNECVHLAEQCRRELRTISYLLHPPYFDELGLTAALRDFVDGFATRSGIQVALEIDSRLGRLGRELELAIYRVVQEALSNVYRHSQSRTAAIALARHAEFVQLEVADAGRGIPPELLAPNACRLAGVGIAGMRERVRLLGGRLEIQSGCNGTRVQAVLPLDTSVRCDGTTETDSLTGVA